MTILKIKEWKENRAVQFRMFAPHTALRIKDGKVFVSSSHANEPEHSKIWYNERKATLLEFMSNMILVQIEVRKPNFHDLPGMEFNPDNYEVLHVPINNIERRNGIKYVNT